MKTIIIKTCTSHRPAQSITTASIITSTGISSTKTKCIIFKTKRVNKFPSVKRTHCRGRRFYSIVKKCIIKFKRNIYFSSEFLIYEHKYLKQGWNYIDQKVIMNNSVSQYNNIKLLRTANSPTSYKSKKLIVGMMNEGKRRSTRNQ